MLLMLARPRLCHAVFSPPTPVFSPPTGLTRPYASAHLDSRAPPRAFHVTTTPPGRDRARYRPCQRMVIHSPVKSGPLPPRTPPSTSSRRRRHPNPPAFPSAGHPPPGRRRLATSARLRHRIVTSLTVSIAAATPWNAVGSGSTYRTCVLLVSPAGLCARNCSCSGTASPIRSNDVATPRLNP